MDVLQLLKAELRSRKEELTKLTTAKAADRSAILSRLNMHLAWESEFLWPELTVVGGKGDAVLDRYQQSLGRLQKLIVDKGQDGLVFIEAFNAHAETVEDKILPYMRQKIPTVEREELYHVFEDAKHEMMTTRSVEFAI